MGAGLHGKNGLTPKANIHLLQVYILPILLHGLEILLPTDAQLKEAIEFLEDTVRALLSLPGSVANPAVYLLSGLLPIQAKIHLKALALYSSIAADSLSLEWRIAERQIYMDKPKTKSWFHDLKAILRKYSLPSAIVLLHNPPSKGEWKRTAKNAVHHYWTNQIQTRAALFPSLKYLNVMRMSPGNVHYVLSNIANSSLDIKRVPSIVRVITGTMSLQSNRAQFNHLEPNKICLLCKLEIETRDHFVRVCPRLQSVRAQYSKTLDSLLGQPHLSSENELWTKCILDPLDLDLVDKIDDNAVKEIIILARKMIHKLVLERGKVLHSLPTRRRDGL